MVQLGEPVTLKTADYSGLDMAWQQVRSKAGGALPRTAALAVASPIGGRELNFTNSDWVVRPACLNSDLGLDRHLLINDFGAVAHAVQHATPDQFAHVCGPDVPLPGSGSVTICGPGTGLGVAQLLRAAGGYHVIESEGGHIGFAPSDAFEDMLVAKLREKWGRVSAERLCGGPAIMEYYQAIASAQGWTVYEASERALWSMALGDGVFGASDDSAAAAALDRFCLALGTVAGDLALAQGAKAVVIAGGLGLRLKDRLPRSGFAKRFRAKGRFAGLMAKLPVKLITHPQPGLFGAAAAFAARFT